VALKYKLTVLTLVIVAAVAVLILTNQDAASIDEAESGQVAAEDSRTNGEEIEEDGEFKPANDPYQAYLDAGEAGRPAVIKFYARW